MNISRAKPVVANAGATLAPKSKEKALPRLEDFLMKRDYVGAITLIKFMESASTPIPNMKEWMAFCHFHLGDYVTAHKEYSEMVTEEQVAPQWHLYLACCQFCLGMYKEADESALKGPEDPDDPQHPDGLLKNRLLFHLSHKFNDEKRLMGYHQKLQDVIPDQLTLASIHYLRNHYQEAIDIYKKVQEDNPGFKALDVYIGLCYYKLDYYDVSQEVLEGYLQSYPDSATTINLKACNHFRLFNGKAAEAELQALQNMASSSFEYAQELIKHNLVVFRNGESALQVLPPLIDVLPEARLNLVIYFLREHELQEAHQLLKDLEPTTPQEYILKGVVNAALGQEEGSSEHLNLAQQYFQLVGGSASECDTIPGRQCMASCFFILKHFDDVLIYLNSIKDYFYRDDTFNYNFGQALASRNNKWKEAEEALLLVTSDRLRREFTYLGTLARCYIMNRKPRLAWELYLKMETSSESFNLITLIANDCYKMGQFYYSCKAFDVLERLDPNPEFWKGKRGACVGVFQQIIAKQEPRDSLQEIVQLLRNTQDTEEVEYIIGIMKRWAKENRVNIS
eukprot:m.15678 g.15678  ORF g.15678 m.15678 type:complete len:566 (-) comp10694_c0_seq1:168-1865(-)